MNHLEVISQNVDFGQKGANLDQKGSKMGMARFLPDCKPHFFFKEDHKIGFYTKYQQNSTSRLGDTGQNVDFGPKRGKFGPFGRAINFLTY